MKAGTTYQLHDHVEMKSRMRAKRIPGKSSDMGMDIRIKCDHCGQMVLMPRREFEKKMKKVTVVAAEENK